MADYSQIELRVAALIAKESVMIGAFKTKADLHKITAAAVLRNHRGGHQGRPANGQGRLLRLSLRAIRQGFVAYAGPPMGEHLPEDAERFRENFFSTYLLSAGGTPNAAANRRAQAMIPPGLFWPTPGRARRMTPGPGLTSHRISGQWVLRRLIKVAMMKVSSVMPSDVHLVATIHDELVYDVPVDNAEQYLASSADDDCGVRRDVRDQVPVEVEAKVCANWGEK